MKRFFLLILSLMTGWEVRSEKCREGPYEYICSSFKTSGKYQLTPALHHYADKPDKPRIVKVIIKQHADLWKHRCNHQADSSSQTVELKFKVDDKCPKGPKYHPSRGANITITCDHSGNKDKSKFFCKDILSTCEDILSRNSDRRFTVSDTARGFNVSIRNVSSQDEGVYWYGVMSSNKEKIQKVSLTKIRLSFKSIASFIRYPTIGQNFSYWCSYKEVDLGRLMTKFICKGEDPSECEVLANTTESHLNKRFSIFDDKEKKKITINIREVTTNDTGTYWCGIKKFDLRNTFLHKFFMNVSSAASTSPVPATVSPQSEDGFQFMFAVISCVAVLLLMLLLFVALLIFIYKRWSVPKQHTNAAAETHPKENIYEEVQERLRIPDSENAMNTVYVTANLPENPTPTVHYSTIHFQNSPDRAGREALIPKPSSTACQYSTVKYSRSPTDSAVSQLSGPTGEPLYSTVNKQRKL